MGPAPDCKGKKCSVCGTVTVAQTETPATGHKETVVPGKAATCTEKGLTDGKKCSNCGEIVTPQTVIPAKGHTPVTDKAVAQADPDVQAAVSEIADRLGDTGRILVRESGTEPVVRVMVEAATEEICQEYVDYVVDTIKRKGHAV